MEEINTTQSTNINQSNTLEQPTKNNNTYKYLFFISIIILVGVIIGFYLILNNKITQLSNKQTNNLTSTQTKTDQEIITENEIISTVIPTVVSTEPTLTENDANNYLYTNNKIGFSLVVPKTFASDKENCKKVDDSYQAYMGIAPVTFFENGDTFYFAGKYFYRLTGEQKITTGSGGAYITKFSGCQKEDVSLASIKNNSYTTVFKFYTANVKNDNELENYIKSKYGTGCKLGEKTLSSNGTYSVKILGDGKELGETQCPINFMIDTEYNPTKGKVVIFELGQDCSFNKEITPSYGKCTALEIVKSLKFL